MARYDDREGVTGKCVTDSTGAVGGVDVSGDALVGADVAAGDTGFGAEDTLLKRSAQVPIEERQVKVDIVTLKGESKGID